MAQIVLFVYSVVFSLLFTVPHVRFLVKTWNVKMNALVEITRYYSMLGICSALSSALFHSRDTWITERLDYHFALAFIICSFCVNCLELMKSPAFKEYASNPVCVFFQQRLFRIGTVLCTCHILYLNFVHFDYGWNMTVAVFFQGLSNLCWIIQYWKKVRELSFRKDGGEWKNDHLLYGLAVVPITALAGVLELVWDDPPFLYLLDSHALFHIFLCVNLICWYNFINGEIKVRSLQSDKQS